MKKIARVLAIILIGISVSGCSVQNYEEDHSNGSSIDFSQYSELDSETTVNETTEYSKYPNSLTSYNLSELGDFVVLTGTNSELDYVGYDYAFTKIQVLHSLYNEASVYSVSGNYIIVKDKDLNIVETLDFDEISESAFNISIDHGRGTKALTISDYDKNNGTFYLKDSKHIAFCAPYDEVDWDSCYLTTYGRLNSEALVTSLK